MPQIAADRLERIAGRLLVAAGASAAEAGIVSRHLIAANLAGHDSHGIIHIPGYIASIQRGHMQPGAPFDIIQESRATTVVDGNWGFGFTVSERAMQLTIDKARQENVAAATVVRQGHVGRLTDYPLMAAEAGMIGLMTADSGRGPKSVAPFGGREPRLGTNPICIAVPSNLDGPFYIDIATSAVAGGKLGVAIERGQSIPTGWVIDSEGRAATDPAAARKGGAMLPLGGSEGHKGYGLSAMVEILSGLLTGLGFGIEPTGRHNDGCFMAVFQVDAFRPLKEFKQEVTEFAQYLTATPPAEGVERVYYPGELEYLRTRKGRVDGIYVEDGTWQKLIALAAELGVDEKLFSDPGRR
ncbi:MAG: Ldh family oxidoreductase [Caldilineaceae bacterium]|nr:Ldh family oxidoreductase [Caldilineaceae bacterium]